MALDSYAQGLAYLYSLTDYEKQSVYLYAPERFDLGRVHRLLEAIGDPYHRFVSLHIAGTKGKGSVAAISERILRQAGYRTGLFTSPHLHTFRERIQVSGQLIPEAEVVEGMRLLQPLVSAVPSLTTFEVMTALAFWHFARRGVDIAVVEVGLGGRLDATNVITPLVSTITSLSYDHTAILGQTLSAIAREKAGIIKPGVPVVSAPQPSEALAQIEVVCRERGAPLVLVGRDWHWQAGEANWQGQSLQVSRDDGQVIYDNLYLALAGAHQLINATVALATLAQLPPARFPIGMEAIRQGMAQVRWPGRLEVLNREPWVVIDGAHNAASAQELRRALGDLFPHRRLGLIFATYRDKDIPGIMEALLPIADRVIVTQFDSPRAAQAAELEEFVHQAGKEVSSTADVGQALSQARQWATAGDLICVTGSVRFVGEARLAWAQAEGLPLPPTDPPLPSQRV